MNNTKTGGVIAGIIMVLVVVMFAINIQQFWLLTQER